MRNGRCRMHGGASTGPRTSAGLARSRQANSKHGRYSAKAKLDAKLLHQLFLFNKFACGNFAEHSDGGIFSLAALVSTGSRTLTESCCAVPNLGCRVSLSLSLDLSTSLSLPPPRSLFQHQDFHLWGQSVTVTSSGAHTIHSHFSANGRSQSKRFTVI
jgi:hypothetical protein